MDFQMTQLANIYFFRVRWIHVQTASLGCLLCHIFVTSLTLASYLRPFGVTPGWARFAYVVKLSADMYRISPD